MDRMVYSTHPGPIGMRRPIYEAIYEADLTFEEHVLAENERVMRDLHRRVDRGEQPKAALEAIHAERRARQAETADAALRSWPVRGFPELDAEPVIMTGWPPERGA